MKYALLSLTLLFSSSSLSAAETNNKSASLGANDFCGNVEDVRISNEKLAFSLIRKKEKVALVEVFDDKMIQRALPMALQASISGVAVCASALADEIQPAKDGAPAVLSVKKSLWMALKPR